MTYEYKCTNIQCERRNEIVEVTKLMEFASASEYCPKCKEAMQKIFGSPAIKTKDGYKG